MQMRWPRTTAENTLKHVIIVTWIVVKIIDQLHSNRADNIVLKSVEPVHLVPDFTEILANVQFLLIIQRVANLK